MKLVVDSIGGIRLVLVSLQSRWMLNMQMDPSKTSDGRPHHRASYAYRYNLLWHIGDRSTIGNPADRYAPSCYQLLFDYLFPGEQVAIRDHGALSF